MIKADTDEGFCFRSMLEGQFARLVHTGGHSVGACFILWYARWSSRKFFQFSPGSCFKIFNQFNTVEHFAGWKSWSQEWITPIKSLVLTEELCSRSVPLEQNPSRVSALTRLRSWPARVCRWLCAFLAHSPGLRAESYFGCRAKEDK